MGTKLTVPTEVAVGVLGQVSFHSGLEAHEETKPQKTGLREEGEALPFYSSLPSLLSILCFL